VGIETDSAFGVPDGNDQQVSKVVFERFSRRALLHTYWSWSDGMELRNFSFA
jgi:hypothetical protein